MTTKVTFRWEQDGAGGEHGMATYFVGTPNEVSLRIDTFAEAHKLDRAIVYSLDQQRWDARAGLLAEIARIKP
jgi:alkanesulfonate monooxygenase SsuD/methylene tetrahydromethanopterin reductase-like flavin-dependent oxidoreductase (luciferase family)